MLTAPHYSLRAQAFKAWSQFIAVAILTTSCNQDVTLEPAGLAASSPAISFNHPSNSPLPETHNLIITASSGVPVIAVSPLAPWLLVETRYKVGGADLILQLAPAPKLKPGIYTTEVHATLPGTDAAELIVPVTLNISPAEAISANTSFIDLVNTIGNPQPAEYRLTINMPKDFTLSSVKNATDWLKLSGLLPDYAVTANTPANARAGQLTDALVFSAKNTITGAELSLNLPITLTLKDNNPTLIASSAFIKPIGRQKKTIDGGLAVSFPAAGAAFDFKAQKLTVNATADSAEAYLDILIDGKPTKLLAPNIGTGDYELFSAANPETHRIEILKRTEADFGTIRLNTFTLTQGAPLPRIADRSRKLLFMGASVTCGRFADRDASCNTGGKSNSGRLSHAFLLGELLNAETQLVCASGRGILAGAKTIPATDAQHLFSYATNDKQTYSTWSQDQYHPDAVVIGVGNNDINLEGYGTDPTFDERFIRGYASLIKAIRSQHPAAAIIITEGPIVSGDKKNHLGQLFLQISKDINDPKTYIMPSKQYPPDCNDHPSAATHSSIASDMALFIIQTLNW